MTAQEVVNLSALKWWKEMESIRIQKAQRMYYWLFNEEDKIKEYVKYGLDGRSGMSSMFLKSTLKKMNIRVFNIVPRVVDKLAFVYKESPERFLDGGRKIDVVDGEVETIQSEDDVRYQDLLQKSTIGRKQNEWNRLSKPFNTVLVQPRWVEDDNKAYMDFLIHTPAWCVVETSKKDWLKADAFYYPIWMQLKEGEPEEQVIVYWSKTEHFIVDTSGNKLSVPGNPENKNPYGVLPCAVLRLREDNDFWGEGWWDLVDGNEEICEQVSNLYYVAKFQAHGQPVLINPGDNAKREDLAIGPDRPIVIKNAKSDEVSPSFSFVSANPELQAVRDLVDWAIKTIQMLKGLSPQQYGLEASVASGASKIVDSAEINEIRKNDMNVLTEFEYDLFDVTRAVYNYHNPGKQISDSAVFSIKFQEPKMIEAQSDKNARRKFALDNDLASRIDFIVEDNPGISREDAEKKFEQIVSEKRKLKDELGLDDMFNQEKENTEEEESMMLNPNQKQSTSTSQNRIIERGS